MKFPRPDVNNACESLSLWVTISNLTNPVSMGALWEQYGKSGGLDPTVLLSVTGLSTIDESSKQRFAENTKGVIGDNWKVLWERLAERAILWKMLNSQEPGSEDATSTLCSLIGNVEYNFIQTACDILGFPKADSLDELYQLVENDSRDVAAILKSYLLMSTSSTADQRKDANTDITLDFDQYLLKEVKTRLYDEQFELATIRVEDLKQGYGSKPLCEETDMGKQWNLQKEEELQKGYYILEVFDKDLIVCDAETKRFRDQVKIGHVQNKLRQRILQRIENDSLFCRDVDVDKDRFREAVASQTKPKLCVDVPEDIIQLYPSLKDDYPRLYNAMESIRSSSLDVRSSAYYAIFGQDGRRDENLSAKLSRSRREVTLMCSALPIVLPELNHTECRALILRFALSNLIHYLDADGQKCAKELYAKVGTNLDSAPDWTALEEHVRKAERADQLPASESAGESPELRSPNALYWTDQLISYGKTQQGGAKASMALEKMRYDGANVTNEWVSDMSLMASVCFTNQSMNPVVAEILGGFCRRIWDAFESRNEPVPGLEVVKTPDGSYRTKIGNSPVVKLRVPPPNIPSKFEFPWEQLTVEFASVKAQVLRIPNIGVAEQIPLEHIENILRRCSPETVSQAYDQLAEDYQKRKKIWLRKCTKQSKWEALAKRIHSALHV